MPTKHVDIEELRKAYADAAESPDPDAAQRKVDAAFPIILDELEQVRETLRALVAKLPKCHCGKPATYEYRLEGELEQGCDEHRPAASECLPYTAELRSLWNDSSFPTPR